MSGTNCSSWNTVRKCLQIARRLSAAGVLTEKERAQLLRAEDSIENQDDFYRTERKVLELAGMLLARAETSAWGWD